jgi:hypothetical protein
MVDVPAETPVTDPPNNAAVATPVLLLLQAPPVIALLSVTELPTHVFGVPVMPVIFATTVTVLSV